MKYGFIGCGNMGSAVARAVCKGAGAGDVLLANCTPAKAEKLAGELGCACGTNEQVAGICDFIFLGVKPQMMADMLDELSATLESRAESCPFVLVTMAAGLSMQQIRQMPHRPAQQGFTAGGQGLGIAKDKGGQAVLRTAGAACVITADTADLRPFGAQGQRQGTAQLAAAAKDEDRTMERQSHGRIVKKKRPGRKGPAAHGLRQAMDRPG